MPADDELLVSASDIAEIAGVGLSAVSNWRRRRREFPLPAERGPSGGDLFRLGEVRRWLEARPDVQKRRSGRVTASASRLLLSRVRGVESPDRAIEIATALLALRATGRSSASPMRSGEPAELGQRVAALARELDQGSPDSERLFTALYDSEPTVVGELARPLLHDQVEPDALAPTFEELLRERQRARLDRSSDSRSTTPVAALLVSLAEADHGTVLDPAAGEGGFLLEAVRAARAAGREPPAVIGQEKDLETLRLAKQRFLVHGIPADLRHGDSILTNPATDVGASAVLCDPPYGYTLGTRPLSLADERWRYGLPPANNLDLAWVQLAVHALQPGGRGCILLPNGSLYRGGQEAQIRVELLRANALEAVITLPAGAATSTLVPVAIWIVRAPTPAPNGRVLLIDAGEESVPAPEHAGHQGRGGSRQLPPARIEKIRDTVRAWRAAPDTFVDVPGFATAVSIDELTRAEGTLTPSRWVGTDQSLDPNELIANLGQLAESLAHLGTKLEHLFPRSPPPVATSAPTARERLGTLLDAGDLDLFRGRFKLEPDAEREEGLRVLGPWDFRGQGARYVDPAAAPRAQRTEPGDIVLDSRRASSAFVDHQGGAVVAAPLQIVRVANRERFDPVVVAAFLSSPQLARIATGSALPLVRVRDLELPILDAGTTKRLEEALDLLGDYERLGRETAEGAGTLRAQLLRAVLSGRDAT